MARPRPDAISPAVRQALRDAHLLLVPEGVSAEVVDALVRQRVDDGRLLEVGRARLGRRSAVYGPFRLDDETALAVRVPGPWSVAYALEAPPERDAAAYADIADPVQRAWWMRLFPDGKPFREEGDVVDLALSLARRLGGAVRIGRRPVHVQPDPGRLVDLTVWSSSWLWPQQLLAVVSGPLPGASLDLGGRRFTGPATDPEPWSSDLLDPAVVDVSHAADERLRLAAQVVAAANDARVLAGPDVVDGFEVRGDSHLRVGVMHEEHVPPWVRRRLQQAVDPVVTFSVGWQPADVVPLEAEQPPYAFRLERERVRPRLRVTARAIAEVTHGVVTDADGFEVDRYTLGR